MFVFPLFLFFPILKGLYYVICYGFVALGM